MMNQAGVAVGGMDTAAAAVGRQAVEGAGNVGNSNSQAFDYNFGERKEEGQTPNSEDTDFHGIAVEAGVVEVGSEQVVEDQVRQEGMAGKKPCPNPQIRFSSPIPAIQFNSIQRSEVVHSTKQWRNSPNAPNQGRIYEGG